MATALDTAKAAAQGAIAEFDAVNAAMVPKLADLNTGLAAMQSLGQAGLAAATATQALIADIQANFIYTP